MFKYLKSTEKNQRENWWNIFKNKITKDQFGATIIDQQSLTSDVTYILSNNISSVDLWINTNTNIHIFYIYLNLLLKILSTMVTRGQQKSDSLFTLTASCSNHTSISENNDQLSSKAAVFNLLICCTTKYSTVVFGQYGIQTV